MKTRKRSHAYLLAILPFILLVILFLFIPMISMVVKSFLSPETGAFTLNNYVTIFTKRYYLISIANSLQVSLISTAAGIVIAFIAAFCYQKLGKKYRKVYTSALNMTSNFAGVTLAFSFMLLLGKTGTLVNLAKHMNITSLADFNFYSVSGLMITYIYFQIPLGTLLLIPAFDSIKQEWKESAQVLKASSFQFWFRVGIPVLMPSILGTLSILFANSLSAYGTAYALMGNNFSLMTIRIAGMFTGDVVQQVELGSAMSTVLALLMCVSVVINMKFMGKAGELRK